MRVECDIDVEASGPGDPGRTTAGCTRCGHQVESAGDQEVSERRCLALMREECPRGAGNFYVASPDPGYAPSPPRPAPLPVPSCAIDWQLLWQVTKEAGEL